MEAVVDIVTETLERTDHIFENVIGDDSMLSVPIELRHPFIFYRGHMPCFFDLQLLQSPRTRDLRAIFARCVK